jgi:hypothetical protein
LIFINNHNYKEFYVLNYFHIFYYLWGLGIGDWGLGIGDWGLGIGNN